MRWRCRRPSSRLPAGYGKTTLLAQFEQALRQTGHAVHWLSVVSSDREPESFLAALSASCGLPEPTRAESADRRLTRIANSLSDAQEPGCILLDDADRLSLSPSAPLLYELIEALPAGFHVICTGRAAPELPSARERGYGRLFELGAADLSFDAADIAAVFAALGAAPPAEAEVERFLRRSEGWPMIVRRESAALAAAGGALFPRSAHRQAPRHRLFLRSGSPSQRASGDDRRVGGCRHRRAN